MRGIAMLLSVTSLTCGDDSKKKAGATGAKAAADAGNVSCFCVPVVRSVRIVPETFSVQPGSTFELRARLFEDDGTEIPEFLAYSPHWTITAAANVSVLSREGHRVTLAIPNDIAVPEFRVIAEAGASPPAASPEAKATVIKASSVDHIVAERHQKGTPLSVALAEQNELGSWDVTPVGFSGFAELGDLRTLAGQNGAVMVFSSDHAMAYAQVGWSPNRDYVRYQSENDASATVQQNPQPTLKKDVTIWIDQSVGDDQWPATTREAIARIHLADINQTFVKNRIGVEFNLKGIFRITGGTQPSADCGHWGAPVEGETFDGVTHATFDPANATDNTNAIDVFVIYMGIGTAASCSEADADPADPFPGYRVFLPSTYTLPHLLGHELGHVLLDGNDGVDHGNAADIGPTNLLNQSTVKGAVRRTHLSIGQACQMNLSSIVKALRQTAGLPVPVACPRITKDVQ